MNDTSTRRHSDCADDRNRSRTEANELDTGPASDRLIGGISIPRLPTYVYWVLPVFLISETAANLVLLMSKDIGFPPISFIVLAVIGSVVVGIPVLIAFCKVWYRWAARTFEKPLSLEAFFGPDAFFGFFIETLLIFKLDSGLSARYFWFKYYYYGLFILSFAAIPVGFTLYVLLMFR